MEGTKTKSLRSIKVRKAIYLTFIYTLLVLVSVFFMFPVVYMLNKSFMTYDQSMALPLKFFPVELYLGNYRGLFDAKMVQWFGNTLLIMVVAMIMNPLVSSWIAYGFSKLDFHGRKLLFMVMMGTTMLPGMVLQIPMFIIYNQLGWMNTLWPFIVPNFFGGGALSVFLIIQFMRSIPREMDQAAMIDGATAYRRFFHITLPLCFPILIFMEIGIFNSCWNDYFGPLLYINDENMYTLAFGIYMRFVRGTAEGSNLEIGAKMAVGVIFSIPPIVLFFVFQKQLIEGVMIGGVKG